LAYPLNRKEFIMANNDTLAELESRIAFQEDAIDKLRELGDGDDAAGADPLPPHY
jgi:uncharacterized coiled-coil protein SlyX